MHACIMFIKFRGRLNWIFFFYLVCMCFLSCSAWYTNAGIWYNKYDIDTKKIMLIHMTVYIQWSSVYSIFKSCLKKRWVWIFNFFFLVLCDLQKKKNHWMMSCFVLGSLSVRSEPRSRSLLRTFLPSSAWE